MTLHFLWREADHRRLQPAANDFSNLPHRYSLFGDCIVPAASFVLLERQPVEMGDIENVRRRPTIDSLAYVRRDSLLASHLNRIGDEALLDRVVDLRKTD